ncbi:unnamed protein product [Rotaria socialis]
MASSSSTSYDSVKQEIYQLYASSLIPSIDAGLTLTEFCREYERRYNHGPIPYHDLGYETLSRFLGSMKDIILMNYKEWPTRCYLNENGDVNQRTEKIRVRTGTETYDEVKNNIYSILTSSISIKYGLSFTELCQQYSSENDGRQLPFAQLELCREYERRYNHGPIPYHDLGYETLSRFLGSMKDIILMNYKEWPTRCYLNENGDVNQRTEKIRVRTGTETYDEVKNNIYSILISSIPIKYGLSFTELCQQYSSKNDGRQLPFAQLGYATLTDLLKTMWDVVRIENRRCYLSVEKTMKVQHKKKK